MRRGQINSKVALWIWAVLNTIVYLTLIATKMKVVDNLNFGKAASYSGKQTSNHKSCSSKKWQKNMNM